MINSTGLYMDPIHGFVQYGEDWIADSAGWCGDIPVQLASLIQVELIDGEWSEV